MKITVCDWENTGKSEISTIPRNVEGPIELPVWRCKDCKREIVREYHPELTVCVSPMEPWEQRIFDAMDNKKT